MLKCIAGIDEFKGSWQAGGRLAPERLKVLKRVATVESVGSSTRIEGANLTNQEIENLLSGLDISPLSSRDEQEVAGYADAVNIICESYPAIPFTENHVRQLHKILLGRSSKDIRHRGEYKKIGNSIQAVLPDGRRRTVFETASPFDTPGEMTSLLDWTNSAFEKEELHPLLTIGIFTVCFLAIHPFQDGNGRLSRLLTTLPLLKSGYVYVPYSSLESVIERNKEKYYLALRKTQVTLKSENADYGPWLEFFLFSLKTQADMLAEKTARERKTVSLPELSDQIIRLVKAHGRLAISDMETMTGANRNTLKKRLRELVRDRYLEKHGRGRGTRYITGPGV